MGIDFSATAQATAQTIPFGAAWMDDSGQGTSSLVNFGDGAVHAVLVGRFATVALAWCPGTGDAPTPNVLHFGASHERLIDGTLATGTDMQSFEFGVWCLPSPGAVALLAMGGFGSARRRRQ